MARQVTSISGTNSAIKSVLQSAKEIQNSIDLTTYYTADPNLTNFPSEDPERTRELSSGLTKSVLALRNSRKFQLALERLQSSKEPLNKTDQAVLNRLNKFSEKADILNQTGNVYNVASRFKMKSRKFAEQQLRTVFLNQQRGGDIVFEAMDRGATSVGEVEKYAVEKHGFRSGNLPTQEYIQRALDSKKDISKWSTTDAGSRQELLDTSNKFRSGDITKDIETGTYQALRRSAQADKVDRTLSAGLLGLAIGKAGAYGTTMASASISEYAGFMKNTFGAGYDYGTPYGNVIQQEVNKRQAGIGLVASAIGAGVGFLVGGGPGAFVGGAIGTVTGNIENVIGGGRDKLQAEAHAEYIQQAMEMSTLINTRPDIQRIMGKYANYKKIPGIVNMLDVKTPTRMMVAKGAVSVNRYLTPAFIKYTADEALASNMSYAQSEDYGYNKAIISRYAGGSKLDLGGMARTVNIGVGDLAQRTLDYIPVTKGDVKEASQFAQKSFSQSNGFTQRQLEYGGEDYVSKYLNNIFMKSFTGVSYKDIIERTPKGKRALDKLYKGADNNNLTDMLILTHTKFNDSNRPYYDSESIPKQLSGLGLTAQQESSAKTTSGQRVSAYNGVLNVEDVNKSLKAFEGGLSGTTVQLRGLTDDLLDLRTVLNFNRFNNAKFDIHSGYTGGQ